MWELLALGVGYRVDLDATTTMVWRDRLQVRWAVYTGRPVADERWGYAASIARGVVQGDRVLGPRAYRRSMVASGLFLLFISLAFYWTGHYWATAVVVALGIDSLWFAWVYPRLHARSTELLATQPDTSRAIELKLATQPPVPWQTRAVAIALAWMVASAGYGLLVVSLGVTDGTSRLVASAVLGAVVVAIANYCYAAHHRRVATVDCDGF